jgi:hypothetical protein
MNGDAKMFSIPLLKASQNKLINETELAIDDKWLNQFYTTLSHSYKKAPFYGEVLSVIEEVFDQPGENIADLTIRSVEASARYMEIDTKFELSSEKYPETRGMDKADRLCEITKRCGSTVYVNPAGGKELYDKPYFKTQGVDLYFIENTIAPYQQFKNEFVGGLSIIDVMMFNPKEKVKELINDFELI